MPETLTTETKLAEALPGAPVVVPKASSCLTPSETVAAVTAPLSGAIPGTAPAVVVPVKEWTQSWTIGAGILAIGGGILDGVFNAILPMLGDGPIDKERLKRVAVRAALVGGYGAFNVVRRAIDNSAIRSLPLLAPRA